LTSATASFTAALVSRTTDGSLLFLEQPPERRKAAGLRVARRRNRERGVFMGEWF
jgi:hypothetical protein